MKNWFDNDSGLSREDKAKILVTIIPFILIIIILVITLIVSSVKKKNTEPENLQQDIMDYADENKEIGNVESSLTQTPAPEKQTPEAEETPSATESPEATVTPSPYREVMETGKVDYTKVEFNQDEQLKEMMTYWEDNNQKALDDLAHLDRYIAMSYKLRGTTDKSYYGEKDSNGNPNGKGIAVYADNQYYYGEWKNGVRSGKGTWMHYHIHNTTKNKDLYLYHQYSGEWANDLPEGEGSEHYDFDLSLIKENVGYNNNLIGSYSKGLYHGEFYITSINSEGNIKEWNATAVKGSWEYKSENRDKNGRGPVQVEVNNPDNYVWLKPGENKNLGVKCLISKNK